MLKSTPLPPDSVLTARARALAYPEHTAAGLAALSRAIPLAEALAITPEALKAEAIRRAGGPVDFGSAPLDEPLAVLCRSLNDEIQFHALGRLQLFNQLAGLLTLRLRFEDLWRRHPEILDQPVERPIIVIGLPRSGTTILHRLLSRDPAKRSSPFWEQVAPLPDGDPTAPQPDPDPRLVRMRQSLDMLDTVVPDLKLMHELTADQPDEDISLLIFAFASLQFEWSYRVPSYSRWHQAFDHTEGYRYFRRVLQTLQWLRGGERWVLKAPQHLEQLGPLLTVFPDAILVQTHRDPVPAVISLASLTTYGGRRYYDHPNPHAVGADMASIVERLLRKGVEDRPKDEGRFVDIQFTDLIADPLGCVRRIYAVAGDVLSPEAETAMQAWIDDNRQGKHGGHDYAAEDFGLDVGDLRRRLGFYQDRFSIPVDRRFAG
ncbi:sulfotransferase [Caulobacter sp. BK020]|uniref:sulfotransferase family protein n=1 Tax=Caulobacter sp. BK020 TaxID=2512117 RepID=UPI001053ADAF|nr:sulfotransferase [Caulobacter sp. BK020]TCS08140.1 sulfotransferase family protein [Caulobacter sp. BK020]